MVEHRTNVASFENNRTKDDQTCATVEEPDRSEIQLPDVLAALGDPVRLAMIGELRDRGEVVCSTLGAGMPKSTRSHHLKVLRQAGITRTRIDGVERHVRLRRECLEARFPGLLDSVLAGIGSGATPV